MHDRVGRVVCLDGRGNGLAVTISSAPATAAAALASAASPGLVVVLASGAISLLRLRALVRDDRSGAVGALTARLAPAATATPTAPAAGALSAIFAAAAVTRAVLAVAVRVAAGREARPGLRARRLVCLCRARDRDLGRLEDD